MDLSMELTRMAASRALRLTVLFLASLTAGGALANGPALVVDAASGKVLHAERATDPWFPASITKLMTTYVALDMVRRGEAAMDQLLTVSEGAAALPPSKMAFKPGTQVRLDNALRIIMVKSANDVAATIAENLGGSIEGFAARMNAVAAGLGMRESRFVNPHGLPDDRQQTSARDMAILARALYRDFPDQEHLFDIGAIQFGRRIMRNTNGLIGRYPGADGMKTGFICASGFNVVASATRNGRRLITVVMGSPSANERTLKAADLFERGFATGSTIFASFGPSLESLPGSVLQSPPNMRAVICDRRGPMPGEEDGSSPVSAGLDSEAGGPNLFGSGVMAFAAAPNRALLGPRAPVQPVRVWIGAAPPSEADLAAQAAEEEAAEQARLAKRKGRKAVARKGGDSKEVAGDDKPKIPSGAIQEGRNGRTTGTLKPVTDRKAKAADDADGPEKPRAGGKAAPAKADAKPVAITPKPKADGRKPEQKADVKPATRTN
jgi:D-alanyl-D-alanine carboxypeptidase